MLKSKWSRPVGRSMLTVELMREIIGAIIGPTRLRWPRDLVSRITWPLGSLATHHVTSRHASRVLWYHTSSLWSSLVTCFWWTDFLSMRHCTAPVAAPPSKRSKKAKQSTGVNYQRPNSERASVGDLTTKWRVFYVHIKVQTTLLMEVPRDKK